MFIGCVWLLILIGGGLVVTILRPVLIVGFGDFDPLLTSTVKGVIAIIMVLIWILILIKMKNWIFKRSFQE